MGLNEGVMRGKRLELVTTSMRELNQHKIAGQIYLVWSSLESDASNLGYLCGNFHIEPFLCVQALDGRVRTDQTCTWTSRTVPTAVPP